MFETGIAVTTTLVREVHHNMYGFTHIDSHIFVHVDSEGIGVPRSKNNCIKHLYDRGCKYFFLFDDDCYPIRPGWEKHVIDIHKRTGIHHFNFLLPSHHQFTGSVRVNGVKIDTYRFLGGPFLFLTREVVEKVGYANTAYQRWGFWHAAYTHRIHRSGLMPGVSPICSIPHLDNYIRSEDYAADVSPVPNLNAAEKQALIARNRPIYLREIESRQIYYPYT